MSEHPSEQHQDEDEHSSFIKTPKQLLVVIILAFAVPVILIAMLASLASRSVEPSGGAMSEEAIAKRLKPVGEVVIAEGGDAPGQRTGKQIVEAVCAACHATGALNAPKIGDKTAWAPLVKQGHDQLTQLAIKGGKQMPPRGGNPELTDAEVARAVAYMANQAGANFKEPPVEPAAATQQAGAPGAPAAVAAAAPAPAGAPAAAPANSAGKGKVVYEGSCVACHGSGLAGAPKAGDKAAWAPRLKQGTDALYQSVLKGKGAMPPKGGNLSLADADVKAAVDFLVSQAQ